MLVMKRSLQPHLGPQYVFLHMVRDQLCFEGLPQPCLQTSKDLTVASRVLWPKVISSQILARDLTWATGLEEFTQ